VLIIGDGPERAALEAQARSEHLEDVVHFAGRLADKEVHTALTAASLLVVPSLGGEVFGLVVAENMLRGLPIVASDLGAFVEVLGDTGLIFAPGDAAALAERISRLLADPQLRAELGQRARERAFEYCDFRRMLEAHARLYRDVSQYGPLP
jgi:glycosyltransferase involved in cell wall biosynthesis